MQEREAWLALNMVPHVGPAAFALLLGHFGAARRVLKAPLKALEGVPHIGATTAEAIRSFPAEETIARERKRMAARGLRFLTLRDAEYPAPLREIHQPPPVLYIRGSSGSGAATRERPGSGSRMPASPVTGSWITLERSVGRPSSDTEIL